MLALYLVSLGCSKNQVDTEIMLGRLLPNGYELCGKVEDANLILINTCAFIKEARTEADEIILELSAAKNPNAKLVVCGCLPNYGAKEWAKDYPQVDAWVLIEEEADILELLERWFPLEAPKVDSPRIRITPPHYAFLRIADGCNHRCAYCSIPNIRGRFKSIPPAILIKEARRLVDEGVVEINLIAQDSSAYGSDLEGDITLAHLLKKLCQIEDLQWIRIQYLYPATITDKLIDVIAQEEKICNYIDIPLQHINSKVLKNMRRPNREFTESLLQKIKDKVLDVTFRTAFIVGFPGETEADYQELKKYVAEGHFSHLGVFTYSHELKTLAGSLKDDVPEEIKEARKAELMQIQHQISLAKNNEFVGEIILVLLDQVGQDLLMLGRRVGDAPEVDNVVFVSGASELPLGSIIPVKIEQAAAYDLYGQAELGELL